MKVQWKLIETDSNKVIANMGEEFEINLEEIAERFADMIFKEQCLGSSKIKAVGFLKEEKKGWIKRTFLCFWDYFSYFMGSPIK